MYPEIDFSIAIPAYKGKFLKEAIESCLCQTYDSFEIIILDDSSPDDISEICSGYSDNRVKYFRNECNVGSENLVNNWNRCLRLAKGKYFICMGDDDRLTPKALANYWYLIGEYPNLAVYHGQTVVIDENGSIKRNLPLRPVFESVYSLIWNRWNGRNQQYVGDFCYNTEKLRNAGGFEFLPLAWGSDDITAVKTADKSGIANTTEICFQYRENEMSISSMRYQTLKMEAVCLEQKWYQTFLKSVPQNDEDLSFYHKIKEQMPVYFFNKKVFTLWCDLTVEKSAIFKWYKDRSKYDLSIKAIVLAMLRAL